MFICIDRTKSYAYTSTPFKIEKAAVQNMSSVEQGFDLDIKYLEAPAPDGDSYWGALSEQKAKSAALYPRVKPAAEATTRDLVDMPQLFNNFVGNNTNNGAPCDNHLSISNDGQLVSVVIDTSVKSTNGFWLSAATLENYADPLNISAIKYDPKTLYDPINDRFVVVMWGFRVIRLQLLLQLLIRMMLLEISLCTLPGNPF